ncbi:Glutathione gamma-glutamylcysteinyltransferase 3 [Symbiodinium microadriaticum]|uniref:Glutathione gamma-glutamylcysteinyltransferase 3 n=1 Tax=Symbiodinium microadriaticum TaxID=2951 RepID=A0A1Q9C9S6_SYMMI|nr:Glutathione gamma-glutamylcysteinyltransferase 3 [Symbiodinium microadriaticum]CAE7597164.1 PCS3 [Symbiodinium microadriaticum]CAE7731707.1 PCS3 [Symbiodinium sp. KB8]
MTIARSRGVGPRDQRRFMDVFREVDMQAPLMSAYGLDGLDKLPSFLKYALLSHLQYDGAPLALLAEWFRILGFKVDLVSAANIKEDTFRADVAAAFACCPSTATSRQYVLVNYSRSVVGQRMFSGGHYAPIGGFNAEEDKVLLLEVNSWRYPSVWVDLPRLWLATHTQVANGNWRGYLRIQTLA